MLLGVRRTRVPVWNGTNSRSRKSPHHIYPVGISMDTRWSKRWGWNSLDGHGIGRLHSPHPGHPLPDGLRACIGAFSYHGDSPGTKNRNLPEGVSLHHGAAGSMDPASIEAAVKRLLGNGLDVVQLLHENDTTGTKRARDTKKKWMDDNPDSNLKGCACGGKQLTKNAKCVDGSIC